MGSAASTVYSPEHTFWQLTLRNQVLTTALFIPFIGYFCMLVGGLKGTQMLDFSLCLAYAGIQDAAVHFVFRRIRLLPLLRSLQPDKTREDLRRAKIRLLNYSFSEANLAPLRWFIGMGTIYLLFVTRHHVSAAFVLNLVLMPAAGSAVAWYGFYTLSESTLSPLQRQEHVRAVSVAPSEHRRLLFTTRFLVATLGLTVLTLYVFLYLMLEPIANKVFMEYPWLHSVGIAAVVAGFATFVGLLTHAAFKPAFEQTTFAIEAITEGKLSVAIPQYGAHEISAIGYLINGQAERLREVVGQVRAEATELSEQASQLGSEATNLAREASEQSASVEQVSGQVNAIAHSVTEARQSMASTLGAVQTGSGAIKEVTEKMAEIEKQSSEIEAAILLIQGISRQVNLLSLNATIEAARAGAEGRGFAVVADEISKLSDQTKENSKRIQESIQKASDTSRTSKVVVAHAEDQFSKISEFSTASAGYIDRIADASGKTLSESMGQIVHVTGQVVDSSRQVESLATKFREKAAALRAAMRYFD